MKIVITTLLVLIAAGLFATNDYVDAINGNDQNTGTSPHKAWQSLKR